MFEKALNNPYYQRGGPTMKAVVIAAVVSTVLVFVTSVGWSQQPDKEHAELAKALNDAKIPLQRGLTASAKEVCRSPGSTKWRTVSSSSPSTP
jgi:pyrimidine deaminase RibD-like protein